jgi:hypothetical protein
VFSITLSASSQTRVTAWWERLKNGNGARALAQAGAKKEQLIGSSPRTDLIAFAVK